MFRLLAVLFLLATLAPARTFTSTDGKKLDAEIVAADQETVTLRRTKDKRDFKLPRARLSQPDQRFIATWLQRNHHPLGWKRLRIHGRGRNVSATCHPIYGPDRRESNSFVELVLPIGAWVNVEIREFGYFGWPGFVRFDGASDWYLSRDKHHLIVQRGKDGAELIASVSYDTSHADGDGFAPVAEAAIKQGASVSTIPNRRSIPLLPETPLTALHLQLSSLQKLDWSRIPKTVRILHVLSHGETVDFAGVEALADLEQLEVSGRSLQGLEHLAALTKLRSLFLKGEKWDGAEHAHLAKLPRLRHLALLNHDSANLDDSHYEFLTKLRALESLTTTERYRPSNFFPAAHLANCANLTRIAAPVRSSGDSYLKKFSKLTDVSLIGHTKDSAADLLASGALKYVHTLRECSIPLDLTELPALHTLYLADVALPPARDPSKLPALARLDLQCRSQSILASLCKHPAIRTVNHLTLSDRIPEDLSPLESLPNLTSLRLAGIKSTKTTTLDLDKYPALRAFASYHAPIGSISGLGRTEALHVAGRPLKSLGKGAPTNLKALNLTNVESLTSLDGLKNSPDLRFLHLYNCKNLASHSGLADLPNLKHLHISRCAIPNAGVQP